MNSICPEEYLAKKIFGKKSIRFCHNVWTISKNDLACWREKFVFFVILTINFRISWKKLLVRLSWIPPAQGFAMSGTIFFEQWKFLDGFWTTGWKFGRDVKTAFNVSRQTFWETFFARKIKFHSSCWDFGEKLPHMVGENWRLHQNWTLPARGNSWGIFLLSAMILIYFHFWQKTSGMGFKSDLYVFWPKFWGETYFSKELHLFYQFGL